MFYTLFLQFFEIHDNDYLYNNKNTYLWRSNIRLAKPSMYNILCIKEDIEQNPINELSGWKVKHKYRCNTRGGHIALGENIFIMDKDFNEIIKVYEADVMPYAGYVEFIDKILKEADKDALLAKIKELESMN